MIFLNSLSKKEMSQVSGGNAEYTVNMPTSNNICLHPVKCLFDTKNNLVEKLSSSLCPAKFDTKDIVEQGAADSQGFFAASYLKNICPFSPIAVSANGGNGASAGTGTST